MTTSESTSTSAPVVDNTSPLGHAPAVKTPEGPTLTDKIVGLKEEIVGKLTHNPELVQHGKDLLSGAAHVPIHEQTPEEKAAEAVRVGPADELLVSKVVGLK